MPIQTTFVQNGARSGHLATGSAVEVGLCRDDNGIRADNHFVPTHAKRVENGNPCACTPRSMWVLPIQRQRLHNCARFGETQAPKDARPHMKAELLRAESRSTCL